MEIIWSAHFKSDVKYYFKKKRYTKILDDIDNVVEQLATGNFVGDKLEGLKMPNKTAAYKVRLPNSSINIGKSGGFIFVRHEQNRSAVVSSFSKQF